MTDVTGGVAFPCRGGCGRVYDGGDEWYMHFHDNCGAPSLTGVTCPSCATAEIVAVAEHNEAVAKRWYDEAPPLPGE